MIDVRDHGDVRELRLNRPPANALSPELLERLCAHVVSAPSEGARALVISGAGGMFTGGLDVPLLLRLDRAGMMAAWATFHGAMQMLAQWPSVHALGFRLRPAFGRAVLADPRISFSGRG